jgi:hypothetical protein
MSSMKVLVSGSDGRIGRATVPSIQRVGVSNAEAMWLPAILLKSLCPLCSLWQKTT